MSPIASSDSKTVLDESPRIRSKRQPRCQQKPAKTAQEKLFEKLGRDLVDQLVSTACQADPLGLPRTLDPQHRSKVQQTTKTMTTTVQCTTATTEETTPKSNTSRGQDSASDQSRLKFDHQKGGSVFSLDDVSAIAAVEALIDRFGKVSHMGILDKSYSFFVSENRDTALIFKVSDRVAVVGGDPLCELEKYDTVMAAFADYRKQFNWGIAFLGATLNFARYAQNKKWVTMQFGIERVLNPMTNPLLLETGGGKRMISQNRQLLRGNMTLGIYRPTQKLDLALQKQLANIYETWCHHRNEQLNVKAYITVYDPFAISALMTYIYVKDADGSPCGFAALRKVVDGYHIDPCISLPGSPRGVTELLIFSAMSLLHKAGVSYLSLGFEPSVELGEITGIVKPIEVLTRSMHRRAYRSLPIKGKRAFYDKFRPDKEQQGDLYLVVPGHVPSWKHIKAIMHVTNISISKLLAEDVKRSFPWLKKDQETVDAGNESTKAANPL
jgi:Phosphatidylglycerol lysyltransferase, C-terminal